ncbi:ribosomal protein L11 methyltransferase-like protein [Bacteriovorax sp. BSW11_IV]|uniref:N5-glutamine methyltransferase family protein n=1 Tax=Bacteriovorax sp. BSW11_IV TaxID=1353529 RepID=UPI00038A2151|nr:HemK/PrmC family methyltransferase [Bacteriovorax sp. BSW11_IV]EQC50114.1 ribosomal protein L11 methyltransferase-like protein [Bacteriovorax sp. BSW11_IV]
MSSFSFGEFAEKYFKDHKDDLQKHYPGIAPRRLKQELEHFCLEFQINIEDLFESRYVPTLNSPIQRFFDLLAKGTPLEYIREKAYFYRSEFTVNPDVLIPRSETEILVELGVQELKDWQKKTDENLRLCDIGTGSGAIVLSLLQEVDRPIDAIATDISRKALKVAKRNFFNLRYKIQKKSSVHFIETDRLKDITEKFHVIVSNPPYIMKNNDRELVHDQVDLFEPHVALYLNDETYFSWFNSLFKSVYEALLEDGVFIMEGHEDHLQKLGDLARENGLSHVEIIQDYTERDRFLIARKKWIK